MVRQRILVTGGSGFIGSHTVDYLLDQGKEVIILDNLSSGLTYHTTTTSSHLRYVKGDILDFPLVTALVAESDAILHLAAMASVSKSLVDPIQSLQINTKGFVHILEAVRHSKAPIRLVYASSAAVYGDQQGQPATDNHPLVVSACSLPLSPYALQKLHCEHYANLYNTLYGVTSLGLRYFNVYGSRQLASSSYAGVISRFINAYQHEESCTIFGDGTQSRDFINVQEVARANYLALESDYIGALNIATGKPSTLLTLIKYIEQAEQCSLSYQFQPGRVGDIKHSYATTALAKKQLGFNYTIPLSQGIAMLCQMTKETIS